MTDEEKWVAVSTNDKTYDGEFYYAVKTTGIYCRPSCRSRLPNPVNVLYFDERARAEDEGFRPCKRCRPDLLDYSPVQDLAKQMKQIIDTGFLNKAQVFRELKVLGVSPKHSIEIFKEQYGMTPGKYADSLRIDEARRLLAESEKTIVDIAYELGFESISAFYTFFRKYFELSPGEFRRNARLPAHDERRE